MGNKRRNETFRRKPLMIQTTLGSWKILDSKNLKKVLTSGFKVI